MIRFGSSKIAAIFSNTNCRRLLLFLITFVTVFLFFNCVLNTPDSFPDDDEIEIDTGSCQKQTLTVNVANYLSGQSRPPALLQSNYTTLTNDVQQSIIAVDLLSTNFLCTTCETNVRGDRLFNNSRLHRAKILAAVGDLVLQLPANSSQKSMYAYVHPSFVHFVRLIGNANDSTFELDFIQYTAVRTAWQSLSPLLPDLIVLLHSNVEPSGRYWSRLLEIDNVSISWQYIALKPTIRGTRVRQFAHQADFRRLEVLLKYGGIYMDFDVLLFNGTQLLRERWNSECLLQADSPSATTNILYHYWKGWSYMINMGFMSCVKNSPFLRSWLQQYYEDFRPFYWLYNSGIAPTYLARAYRRQKPGALKVHQLSGNLMQDYIVASSEAVMTPDKFLDFLRNRFALHMYHIDYEENTVGESFKHKIRTSNSLLGYLYRYVWFGANYVAPNTSSLLKFP